MNTVVKRRTCAWGTIIDSRAPISRPKPEKKIDSLKTRLLGIKTFAHAQMFDRWIYFVNLWVPLWVPFTTLQTLVFPFEFVVQNLMNDHSNESFWAVHSCTTIYEAVQGDSNFLVCLWHTHTLGIMPYKNVYNLKF